MIENGMKVKVPEEIKDLLVEPQAHIAISSDGINSLVIKAYRRGRESR
jgi:hypothetical protein